MPDLPPRYSRPDEWTEAELLQVARDPHFRPESMAYTAAIAPEPDDEPDPPPADRSEWTTEDFLTQLQKERQA